MITGINYKGIMSLYSLLSLFFSFNLTKKKVVIFKRTLSSWYNIGEEASGIHNSSDSSDT